MTSHSVVFTCTLDIYRYQQLSTVLLHYENTHAREKHLCRQLSAHARGIRLVHNTTLNNTLHCVVASTLVEMQHNASIDSDPILVFFCVVFLPLVVKKPPTFFSNKFVPFVN